MGGAENVAISLAEELHAEFNFSFFAVGGIADNAVGQDMARRLSGLAIPVHSGTALGFKRGGAVQAGLKLRQLIWKLRPEVIHVHTEIPETIFAVASMLGLPRNLQVIRTIHNSKLWPAWGAIGQVVERRLYSARAVGVSAACLQGLWEFQADHRIPLTPKARTQVIYNGVMIADPRLPMDRNISSNRPIRVLFAGRLEPQKGVDLLPELLTAASALTTRPVEVTLLGRGGLEGTLRHWIQTHTLPWTVTLSEPVANLAEHLAEYDVMLVPSRFEGLCLVAVEALMAGMPVVATRVRGLSEIFPPGYPLLCDSEDVPALARILAVAVENYSHHVAMVATHHAEIVARFSLARMAQEYRRIYQGAGRPTVVESME